MIVPWKESYDKPNQHIKKHRYHFAHKNSYSQSYGFSSSHIQIWELAEKEGWEPKNWCFRNVVMEKTLEAALDSKEINTVNPKWNQLWIFIRTDAEAWAPILWPPDAKSWLTGKDPDAAKDWGQEGKGKTDEMVGRHHGFNRHESEQTPGDSKGQGSLVYRSSWDHKELDTTEWLNNNKNKRKGIKGSEYQAGVPERRAGSYSCPESCWSPIPWGMGGVNSSPLTKHLQAQSEQ